MKAIHISNSVSLACEGDDIGILLKINIFTYFRHPGLPNQIPPLFPTRTALHQHDSSQSITSIAFPLSRDEVGESGTRKWITFQAPPPLDPIPHPKGVRIAGGGPDELRLVKLPRLNRALGTLVVLSGDDVKSVPIIEDDRTRRKKVEDDANEGKGKHNAV